MGRIASRGRREALCVMVSSGCRCAVVALLTLLFLPPEASAEVCDGDVDCLTDDNGDHPEAERGCYLLRQTITSLEFPGDGNFEIYWNDEDIDDLCPGVCTGADEGNTEHVTEDDVQLIGQAAECVLALYTQ
jgi:hypothetical protein